MCDYGKMTVSAGHVVRLCPHGRQCECREGETGCSTDLVMSPNIIQHSKRREGGSFGKRHAERRALPCAESAWLFIMNGENVRLFGERLCEICCLLYIKV